MCTKNDPDDDDESDDDYEEDGDNPFYPEEN